MPDYWWFKSLGEEFGPLPYSDLVTAARHGVLAASDLVRHGHSDQWRRADTISGLFSTADERQVTNTCWMIEVFGQTIGPIPLARIADMICARSLLPTDRVRHISSMDWKTLDSVLERTQSLAQNAKAGADDSNQIATTEATTAAKVLPQDHRISPENELERLILELLSEPISTASKSSLCELGIIRITRHADSCPAPRANEHEINTDQSDAPVTASTIIYPTRTPARRFRWLQALIATSSTAERVQQRTEELSQPAPIAPTRQSPREDRLTSGKSRTRFRSNDKSSRFSWLEGSLIAAGVTLAFQLFPEFWLPIWSRIDVRHWAWQNWVVMQVLIIVALVGVRIWQAFTTDQRSCA